MINDKLIYNSSINSYFLQNMFNTLILACVLTTTLALQTQNVAQIGSLGFGNYSGSRVTSQQLKSFDSFVQTANILFETDIQSQLKYIVNQMNIYVGNSTEGYSVVLQTVPSVDMYYVYSANGNNYASRAGIVLSKPDWSYLFYRYKINSTTGNEIFISYLSKGAAITAALEDTINKVIATSQTTGSCDCSLAVSIWGKIEAATGFNWNVVCMKTQNTIAQANVYSTFWIYTHPKQCYYTLWRSPNAN